MGMGVGWRVSNVRLRLLTAAWPSAKAMTDLGLSEICKSSWDITAVLVLKQQQKERKERSCFVGFVCA